jgi:hypothetical protein
MPWRWFVVGLAIGQTSVAVARSVVCEVDTLVLEATAVSADGVVLDDPGLTEVDRWSGELRVLARWDGATLEGPRLGVVVLAVQP